MSKAVKEMMTRDIKTRLGDVSDAVLVSTVGMGANTTVELRDALHEKGIQLMVIKNSLARRATEGTSLSPMFEGASGTLAVCWGGDDFVSLVKEVVALDKDSEKYDHFKACSGAMDGESLDADGLKKVSKWPSREEQISILVGQILSPGANLSGVLLGPGKLLASQIEKVGKEES